MMDTSLDENQNLATALTKTEMKEKTEEKELPPRPPRKYAPIWDRIKKKGRVVIECEPDMFPRIRKAVKKEKWMDFSFKLLNDHDYFFLRIQYDPHTKRAVFTLRESVGLEGVKYRE